MKNDFQRAKSIRTIPVAGMGTSPAVLLLLFRCAGL